jgi:hypothetical protein
MGTARDEANLGREPSVEDPSAVNRRGFGGIFVGAPLDVVKLVAAVLMVIDHVNVVFLKHDANVLWKLGRIAFPLFAFALACNLQRGTKAAGYVGVLLLLGAISQPIYAVALGAGDGNTLFTLAVGATILTALRSQNPVLQHAVFFAGAVAIFSSFLPARSGLDFGLAGMLFPAALFMVMDGGRSHVIWLVLMLVGLNWYYPNPWELAPIGTAMFTAAGVVTVLLLAAAFKNRPRFLPRYALHFFYPGHLLVLMAIYRLA